ncbi:MAG: penicillin-binding protein 1C [Labilithrix sp.]|nr:penicillin-binding protein 1C [Labilithrix sp.]
MALRPALDARARRLRASLGAWVRRVRAARRRLLFVAAAVVAAPFVLVGIVALFTPMPEELREPAAPSLRVHARNGKLLREVRTDDGARARPLPLASFPPHVRSAVLAAEDRRFYAHHGVDLVAVLRASLSNVAHRRVVSGASTITMQLARTVRPHRRSLWGKVTETALALRIEASLSKDRILEEYLNRVVYGPNLRGYAAASHAYLGTAPESLSLAGAALIAGLPRGPSLYAVTKRPDLARRRRDRVLARMAEAGMIDDEAKARAVAEPIVARVDKPAFGAPHFTRALVAGTLAGTQPELAEAMRDRATLSEVHTTIDPELQRAAEGAVATTLDALARAHVTAAAVVVLENATGDVLAWVGSPDFHSAAALGQNDGVLALRQPGSSLKPFVYVEAMSRFGWTGATLLPDVEIHIPLPGGGDYVPHDYDAKQRGPVRLREALGNSLNIPAVHTIHELGTKSVLDRLHAFGFASLVEDAEHYGPALALGGGEVTLLELAAAYATLARGGVRRPLRFVTRLVRGDRAIDFDVPGAEARVLDERVAAMLTDILSDKGARMSAFGDQNVLELEVPVAAKTGTSKGYRDNVAVGYTREVTVAVWAGNFDGSPMNDVSGISGAGPIFREVMGAAARSRPSPSTRSTLALDADAARLGLARTPICALSGEVPTSACPHRIHEWLPQADADHAPPCSTHQRVRLDARNGLRAGPGCPTEVTTSRVFERWRPPYEEWARRTNRALVPEGSSPACPIDDAPTAARDEDGAAREPSAPRVVYPFDGARFVIDPERPVDLQRLDIRVEPSAASTEVFVDDQPIAKTRSWPLAAGPHTITARSGGRVSPPVHIVVR